MSVNLEPYYWNIPQLKIPQVASALKTILNSAAQEENFPFHFVVLIPNE